MNKYARMARDHWRQFLPNRYQQIPDPQNYFTRLGQEVEEEIEQLAQDLAGEDRAGEGYLDKLGRLTTARQQAEEQVLAERILLPAEPGTPLDETTPDEQPAEMTTDWIPTTEDPNRPFYRNQR